MSLAVAVDAGWRERLRQRAQQPPAVPRVPFAWAAPGDGRTDEVVVGSVEPAMLAVLPALGTAAQLSRRADGGWLLTGPDATTALDALARALRDAGLAHVWRNEQLAVGTAAGRRLGSVERAVVRELGIATQAVHLVGLAEDGCVWLQQRAWNKPNDPGKWDTLVGGMVGVGDDLPSALLRETWEEAGLRPDDWQDLRHGGWVHTRKPCEDGGRTGYVVEDIAWSVATLRAGRVPCNQDGEVERFECVPPAELVRRLHADDFTDEAALILVDALGLAPAG